MSEAARLIEPDDEANRALVAEVHPPDWSNPTPSGKYNLVVLGAGTGGLVTAAAAAGLGAKVALIEKHLMGGDCLNVGCVPSKAVIASARAAALARGNSDLGASTAGVDMDFAAAMLRMRQLRAGIAKIDGAPRFAELGVDVFFGHARFTSSSTVDVAGTELEFARAVIATGGRAFVPPIDGLSEAGYLTNQTVFELTELPDRLVVIGGGPIGCELAQSFARLGSKVTLVEAAPRIMVRDDPDAANIVAESMRSDGVAIETSSKVVRVETDRTVVVETADGEQSIAADHILVATGRRPNVEDLGLDAVGVDTTKRGIVVDDRLRTTNRRIYAVGDVCSKFQFTHAADAHARLVIRNALFFGRAKASALVIPWATYTHPEVAGIGLTAEQAAEAGIAIDTYTQDFSHVDRAITDGEAHGFVRVHCHKGKDSIVGASIVAPHAGELIGEVSLAMTSGLGLGSIANTIHPYPTYALALRQTADQYSRTRLTPFVASLFRRILSWRRR